MRKHVGIVPERIAANRNHDVFRFPYDRHQPFRVVGVEIEIRNFPGFHVSLEIPDAAEIPVTQLAFKLPRRVFFQYRAARGMPPAD